MTQESRFAVRLSTRLVVLTPRHAYKIPLGLRGWLQGLNERKLWDSHGKTGLLAPLEWSVGGLVCMTRVRPVRRIPDAAVEHFKGIFPVFRFPRCDLYRPANWGRHEGRLVLLDYGVDERVARLYFLSQEGGRATPSSSRSVKR